MKPQAILRALSGALALTSASLNFAMSVVHARQVSGSQPVLVQPGAPGQPTKILPPETKGKLPPISPADVDFMQGMIMHHAQAVEMTALIPSHTENQELRRLGAKISHSQTDEINFMKRWLIARGAPV